MVELDLNNYLDDPEWNAVVAVGRNVTDAKAAQEQLEHQHTVIDKIGRGDTDDALVDIADILMRQVGRARVAIASFDDSGERHIEIGRGLGAATIEMLMDGAANARSSDGAGVVVFEPAISPQPVAQSAKYLWFSTNRAPLAERERRAIAGAAKFVANLIEQRRQDERLAYKARYDDLTGALNRSHLRERVTQALRRRDCSIALLLVDLDRFQLVNDSYGHDIGDQLLRAFTNASAISSTPMTCSPASAATSSSS